MEYERERWQQLRNLGKKKSQEALVGGANEAAEESMRSALPIRLTEGILQIMLDSLKKAPNIHYVRSFWDAQQKRAIADTQE